MATRWYDFVQSVRRFPTSSLLAESARLSIENFNRGATSRAGTGPNGTDDFALSTICKAAVLHGNEHRRRLATRRDLRVLCALLVDVRDPFIDDQKLASFWVRVGHEQILYQEPISQAVGRVRAMLHAAAAQSPQSLITPNFWQDLLGCTLDEMVGVALLLHAAALKHGGRFDLAWLGGAQFLPVYRVLPRGIIEHVTSTHFIATVPRFRELAKRGELPNEHLRRYEFNPLLCAPFVAIDGRAPIAPVVSRVCWRATPGSLYYTAMARDQGKRQTEFSDALGIVFETYVGMQLRLWKPDGVIPERSYGSAKSVDFIVVLQNVLLLVEAKATPLTLLARAGQDKLSEDMRRAPGKAQKQIENTARLIIEGNSVFADIPRGRPMLGLVVTMEPYYACENSLVFSEAGRTMPISLCSARELEDMMSAPKDVLEEKLTRIARDGSKRSWSVADEISGVTVGRNAILEAAWQSYPFREMRQGS